jgi:hypothetical protein
MRFHALLCALAACGGARPAAPAPAPAPAAHTAADLIPLCKAHYAHQVSCTDDYLSALLDLRISVDMPKGIADEAKQKGKPALLKLARVELDRDMAPDRVEAICNAMTKVPPDQVDRLMKDGQHCAEMTECKAFAACAVETERTYVTSGDQHPEP